MKKVGKVKSLAWYQAQLQRKVNGKGKEPTYSFRMFDNRFSLVECAFMFSAIGKLMRIMIADKKTKVPDDAIDVDGYMELFWKSFQGRERIPVKIRQELYR